MGAGLKFLLAALATWRVAHLLAFEDGPADVVAAVRAAAGTRFLGHLMDCFQCLSLWTAAPLALVVSRRRDWPVVWLALSGAACLLERITQSAPRHGALAAGGDVDEWLLRPEAPAVPRAQDGR